MRGFQDLVWDEWYTPVSHPQIIFDFIDNVLPDVVERCLEIIADIDSGIVKNKHVNPEDGFNGYDAIMSMDVDSILEIIHENPCMFGRLAKE